MISPLCSYDTTSEFDLLSGGIDDNKASVKSKVLKIFPGYISRKYKNLLNVNFIDHETDDQFEIVIDTKKESIFNGDNLRTGNELILLILEISRGGKIEHKKEFRPVTISWSNEDINDILDASRSKFNLADYFVKL